MNIDENVKIKLAQLGLHIQKLRKERNMNINDLSKKTGIRKNYLTKIEKGTAYGILIERHLLKIAKALNIKISELFDF